MQPMTCRGVGTSGPWNRGTALLLNGICGIMGGGIICVGGVLNIIAGGTGGGGVCMHIAIGGGKCCIRCGDCGGGSSCMVLTNACIGGRVIGLI